MPKVQPLKKAKGPDKTMTLSSVNPVFQEELRRLTQLMLTPASFYPPGSRRYAILNDPVEKDDESEDGYKMDDEPKFVDALGEAEVITSELKDGSHMPVLDIDVPCDFVPSTTEGHGHLYFHKKMTWEQNLKLMKVMEEVGLLEPGYVKASEARGYAAVRVPWLKKGETLLGKVTHYVGPGGKVYEIPAIIMDTINPAKDIVVIQGDIWGDGSPHAFAVYPDHIGKSTDPDEDWTGTYWMKSSSAPDGWGHEPAMGVIPSCKAAVKAGGKKSSYIYIKPIPASEMKYVVDGKFNKDAAPVVVTGDVFFDPIPASAGTHGMKSSPVAKFEKTISGAVPPTQMYFEPLPVETIPVTDMQSGAIVTLVPKKFFEAPYSPTSVWYRQNPGPISRVYITYGETHDHYHAVTVSINAKDKTYRVLKPVGPPNLTIWKKASASITAKAGYFDFGDVGKGVLSAALDKGEVVTKAKKAMKKVAKEQKLFVVGKDAGTMTCSWKGVFEDVEHFWNISIKDTDPMLADPETVVYAASAGGYLVAWPENAEGGKVFYLTSSSAPKTVTSYETCTDFTKNWVKTASQHNVKLEWVI